MPIALNSLNEPVPANLHHLGLEWYLPHPLLRAWIQCYWVVKLPQLPEAGISENLYPDGGTTLVIDFAANQLPVIHFNAFYQTSKILFQGRVDKLGIRFHPGGAFQLLGLNMADVMGMEYRIDDWEAMSFNELQEKLAIESMSLERINQIDHWFLQQVIKLDARQGYVQDSIKLIRQSHLSVADLATHLPLGRRQLERKFQVEVGMAPAKIKLLQQIKQARLLISKQPEISLVQVAMETGFYDQAHFNRQFQKITSQTPGQYRQKKMSQKYNLKTD